MLRINIFLIIFTLILQLSWPISSYASTHLSDSLVQIDASTNLQTFYTTNNGQSANTTHFGVYVFHAVGDTLYIGLANYRPADAGSALLAKYSGGSITFVGNLVDEGVNEIVSTADGGILIGGADPHESWALGNVYTYKNDAFSKVRAGNGLENVIHMWGIDSRSNGTLHAAVSSHDGSYPGTCNNGVTCFGEIFKSVDNGATWTRVSRLGAYRAFDVITFNNKLYALYVDEVTGDNRLSVSNDDGQNWTTLKSDGELRRTHMIEFRESLLFLGGGTTSNVLYSMNASQSISQHDLPFNVGISYNDAAHFSNYNQFVVARDGYLYTISSAGDIWRTQNLITWTQVTESSDEYVSIGYWSNPNKLLVSTRGASAKIYSFDLDELTPQTNTNSPASNSATSPGPQITRNGNNGNGGATVNATGDSAPGPQKITAVIQENTFNFDAFLSTVSITGHDLNSQLTQTVPAIQRASGNTVFTGGSGNGGKLGVQTSNGTAWQIGRIQSIWYKAYAPEFKVNNAARIIPELQDKPSIVSLSYDDSDLIPPGDQKNPFKSNSLKLAHSIDGVRWTILPSSVVDTTNKTVAAIHKVGGYYTIVATNNTVSSSNTRATSVLGVQKKSIKKKIRPKIIPKVTAKPLPRKKNR